jgi:amino acid transporter
VIRGEPRKRRVLYTIELVALIFFSVSGGSYGSEGLIKSAGPFYALIAFFIVPFVWCIPIALVTVELSTAFPTDGGPCIWVKHALGDFWAYQQGWWDWTAGVVDNAIYPVLMLDYLSQLFDVEFIWWHALLIKLIIALFLAYLQFRGLEIVGWTSVVIVFFIMIPYVILIFMSAPQFQPSLLLTRRPDIRWAHFINILLWNLNSWESVASLAGEVNAPAESIPRATFISMFLVILTYVIPLSVTYSIDPNMKHWHDGHFSSVGRMVGGEWLGVLFLIGAVLSGSAQYLAEMASDSYQLWGMSKWGMLPKVFGKTHSVYQTPWPAILMSLITLVPVTVLELGDIVQIENTLYSMSLTMECISAVVLRIKEPTLRRPFLIPLSTPALALYLIFPVSLGIFSMAMCDSLTWLVTACVFLTGIALYLLFHFSKKHNWFTYETVLTLDHLKRAPSEHDDYSISGMNHSTSYGANDTTAPLQNNKVE